MKGLEQMDIEGQRREGMIVRLVGSAPVGRVCTTATNTCELAIHNDAQSHSVEVKDLAHTVEATELDTINSFFKPSNPTTPYLSIASWPQIKLMYWQTMEGG